MICEVGGGSGEVVEVRLADVSVLYHQVDWHFAFQAADVPVAEVITELMNLRNTDSHLDPLARQNDKECYSKCVCSIWIFTFSNSRRWNRRT